MHPVRSVEVERLFSTYRDRPFVLVEPGGNAGDQLIYRGAEKVANAVGLSYSVIGYAAFMAQDFEPQTVLYLHGGGGYNPIWSGKPMEMLAKAVRHRGVVIQGPQTFWDDLDFLKTRVGDVVGDAACERLVLMAREQVSHSLLTRVVPDAVEAVLDHDTALNLDASDLAPRQEKGYVYYAIRADKEARVPPAREYAALWGDPVLLSRDFEGWFTLHAGATTLVTNRLHSSILGAILGIPTTLCPNSYFKNRAVWEHSLHSLGVAWSDEIPISPISRAMDRVAPVRWLLSSGWVRNRIRRSLGV